MKHTIRFGRFALPIFSGALLLAAFAPDPAHAELTAVPKKRTVLIASTAKTDCKLVYNAPLKNTTGPLLTNKLNESFPAGTKVYVKLSDGKTGTGTTQSDSGAGVLYSNIMGVQWTWQGNQEGKITCEATLTRQADLRLGKVEWKSGAQNTISVEVKNAGGIASGKFITRVRQVTCNGNTEVLAGTKDVELEVPAHGSKTGEVTINKVANGKIGAKVDVNNTVNETQESSTTGNLCAPPPPA